MKISKKDIQQTVSKSLVTVVNDLNIPEPSKKTNKLIKKVSKKMSSELKQQLKKQLKKMEKATGKPVQVKVSKKAAVV